VVAGANRQKWRKSPFLAIFANFRLCGAGQPSHSLGLGGICGLAVEETAKIGLEGRFWRSLRSCLVGWTRAGGFFGPRGPKKACLAGGRRMARVRGMPSRRQTALGHWILARARYARGLVVWYRWRVWRYAPRAPDALGALDLSPRALRARIGRLVIVGARGGLPSGRQTALGQWIVARARCARGLVVW